VSGALDWLAGLPSWLVYAVLTLGSALENVVPPIPADTFVVVGGLLASRGAVGVWTILALTWAANVGSALVVYRVAHRHGRAFFQHGPGRLLLNEHQLARIRRFYDRFGVAAVFVARFLPGLRAVVPAFAGISHQRFWSVAVPVAGASALWYGALVWAGVIAGRNLSRVEAWLSGANRGLLAAALVLVALVGVWWWRTRHAHEP
jgi:membrane protein DedA with SNARE-associated domain